MSPQHPLPRNLTTAEPTRAPQIVSTDGTAITGSDPLQRAHSEEKGRSNCHTELTRCTHINMSAYSHGGLYKKVGAHLDLISPSLRRFHCKHPPWHSNNVLTSHPSLSSSPFLTDGQGLSQRLAERTRRSFLRGNRRGSTPHNSSQARGILHVLGLWSCPTLWTLRPAVPERSARISLSRFQLSDRPDAFSNTGSAEGKGAAPPELRPRHAGQPVRDRRGAHRPSAADVPGVSGAAFSEATDPPRNRPQGPAHRLLPRVSGALEVRWLLQLRCASPWRQCARPADMEPATPLLQAPAHWRGQASALSRGPGVQRPLEHRGRLRGLQRSEAQAGGCQDQRGEFAGALRGFRWFSGMGAGRSRGLHRDPRPPDCPPLPGGC